MIQGSQIIWIQLLVRRSKVIKLRTEIFPILRSNLGCWTLNVVLWCLGEYDRKTSLKMPIDMTERKDRLMPRLIFGSQERTNARTKHPDYR